MIPMIPDTLSFPLHVLSLHRLAICSLSILLPALRL